jgi:putative sterol carrier protein
MTSTSQFFSDLGQRGRDPLFEKANGTILFELLDGKGAGQWAVTIARGDITVARDDPHSLPTCTVRCPLELFENIVDGRANAMVAVLRGELLVEGDLRMLLLFQRTFPGPPSARGPSSQQLERSTH